MTHRLENFDEHPFPRVAARREVGPGESHHAAGRPAHPAFLMLCYFIAYVDRVNAGFAALQMNKNVGLGAVRIGGRI